MKVLKDNYSTKIEEKTIQENPYPRVHTCENCGSELEYEKSDLKMGVYGCMHLECPLCGYNNMIEENEDTITLTKDNIEFPTHFYHISEETGAKDSFNNEEIKKCIHKAIDYFRKNKNDYSWFDKHGNLYVHISRFDGDESYEVTVTNDYYDTYIPFEPEDY